MNFLSERQKLLLYIIVPVIIILILVVGYYYKYKTNNQNTMFVSPAKLQDAKDSLYDGDQKGAKEKFEAILATPMEKNQKAVTQNFYASALFRSDNDADKQLAAKIIKSIVSDQEISGQSRMFAYNTIANLFVKNSTKDDYIRYFGEKPFIDYLHASPDNNDEVLEAYATFLKLSEQAFPNSYAEYTLAGEYYSFTVAQSATSTEGVKHLENEAHIIQDLVGRGDQRKDEDLFAPTTYLLAKLNKAIALTASNRVLNNIPKEQIEKAYQDAIALGSLEKNNNSSSQLVLYRAKFMYAKFLAENYPAKVTEIKALGDSFGPLATSSDATASNVRAYFTGLSKNPKSILAVYAKKVATYSPAFQTFLVNSGFSF